MTNDDRNVGDDDFIAVKSSHFLFDVDDKNKTAILVQQPQAVANAGAEVGMFLLRVFGDGAPSETGHSRIDAAVKGTRRLGGIELWTFGNADREITVRLKFDPAPTPSETDECDHTASDRQADAAAKPTTLEDDLVRQSTRHGNPRPAPVSTEPSPSLAEAIPEETESAPDGERSSEDRHAEFIRENLAVLERERRRAARPVQRSAVDPTYTPYGSAYSACDQGMEPPEIKPFRALSPRRGAVLYDHARSNRR